MKVLQIVAALPGWLSVFEKDEEEGGGVIKLPVAVWAVIETQDEGGTMHKVVGMSGGSNLWIDDDAENHRGYVYGGQET